MGEFVANTAQVCPFIGGGQPAKLFQPVEAIEHRHGRDLLSQREQRGGHKPSTHVVLQSGVAIGELVEQATILFVQAFQIRRGEVALTQVVKGVTQGFLMRQTSCKPRVAAGAVFTA